MRNQLRSAALDCNCACNAPGEHACCCPAQEGTAAFACCRALLLWGSCACAHALVISCASSSHRPCNPSLYAAPNTCPARGNRDEIFVGHFRRAPLATLPVNASASAVTEPEPRYCLVALWWHTRGQACSGLLIQCLLASHSPAEARERRGAQTACSPAPLWRMASLEVRKHTTAAVQGVSEQGICWVPLACPWGPSA